MNDTEIIEYVKKYTMVSNERLMNVLNSIEYINLNNIQGDFVEIGVCKGGVIMAMALKCKQLGINRFIHAYDTFQGMTKPTDEDIDLNNNYAKDILDRVMCYSSFEETKRNIDMCDYSNIIYHQGNILETDISNIPNISLLRLDTDWYELTKFELKYFEPRVIDNGLILVDDYGHWKGCKKAVDEFLKYKNITINRVDYTGIYWQKT